MSLPSMKNPMQLVLLLWLNLLPINVCIAKDQNTAVADHDFFVLEDQSFGNPGNIFSSNNPLNIHGFATVGGVRSTNDLDFYQGIDNKMGYRTDTRVGLQMSYGISEATQFVIQLVAMGHHNFDLKGEWAYLSHRWTDKLSTKIGRLRKPLYYYSESIDVGFSYPFIRPPLEIYRSKDNSFEAIDLTYEFAWGSAYHTLQAFTGDGSEKLDSPAYVETPAYTGFVNFLTNLNLDDQWGFNLLSNWDYYTLRLGYLTFNAHAQVAADLGGGLIIFTDIDQRSEYYSTALHYDNAQWYLVGEIGRLNAKELGQIPDNESGYVIVGYHFENWMPYVIYGATNTKTPASSDSELQGYHAKSGTFGFQYTLNANTSAKFEVNHYYDFQGGVGPFGTRSDIDDKASILAFAIDVVF
jgi:hypothetical protein